MSVPVNPEQSLKAAGFVLPPIEAPAFGYAPLSEHQGVIYLAGQLAKHQGVVHHQGRVGIEVTEIQAARQLQGCALQALARLKNHCGTLQCITRILHMNVYIACDSDFEHISTLADKASDVFVTAFADQGKHPRSVLGLVRLPQNAPVMIDLRAAITP